MPLSYLRKIKRTMNKLISYRKIIGKAIIDCEKTSGVGEITAPITKVMKITIRRFPFKKAEFTIPIFARITMTSGNSKIKPNGKTKLITKSRYLPTDNKGCKSSVPKPRKNLIPAGTDCRGKNADRRCSSRICRPVFFRTGLFFFLCAAGRNQVFPGLWD